MCVMPAHASAFPMAHQHQQEHQQLQQQQTCAANSLLFAIEVEEEHKASTRSARAEQDAFERATVVRSCCSQPEGLMAAQLVLDVRRIMQQLQQQAASQDDSSSSSGVDVVDMASRLSAQGYRVTVRTALGGGPACFRNLRHEFLTVLGEGDSQDVPYFVDPAFKEQFKIPQPSAAYEALLELLPSEFVGTSSRLVPLVQNLCAEMVVSFEANGLTLPPWRRAASMLTKWLPSRSRDVNMSVAVPTNSSSGAAAAAEGDSGSSSYCGGGSSPAGSSSSPVAADAAAAAAGSSPFSRIQDHEICRQGSTRSLLSGKLGSAPGSAGSRSLMGRSASSSTTAGSCSTRVAVSQSSSASAASSVVAGSMQQVQQQLLQLQQQLAMRQQAQQQQTQRVGAISRQPSLYQGQPPTYTVKMGGYSQQQQ